jgi:hypothetical protein
MSKHKIHSVINCGCRIVKKKQAHSDFQHNKECSCSILSKKGLVQTFDVTHLAVWER